ncbi:hypothetical protein ROHU_023748 [Labeo rohita]|uniref:Uncharacterized protein n=1 Tax=Labeo rohita TaxID=84645 RepID=A0A498MRB3_LABRO|nr:hypothetical protein ROHU_023748 [Labeo rohita]
MQSPVALARRSSSGGRADTVMAKLSRTCSSALASRLEDSLTVDRFGRNLAVTAQTIFYEEQDLKVPFKDDFVLPTPPKMNNAQSGKYGTTTNTMKRRRIPHPANTSNGNQAKKRLTKDHSALGLAKRVSPDPFLRDGVGVPQGLPLIDRDHSALDLAKRVGPDPFLRDSVGVPQGLPLMDGDHSALGLAKRVGPDPFLRDDMGVPQGQAN